MRYFAEDPDVIAVGEIGLDYYRDYAPHDAQTKLFIYQLGLAKQAQLPVVIHNRAADDDTVAILRQWFDGTVVLHCFSSSALSRPMDSRACSATSPAPGKAWPQTCG